MKNGSLLLGLTLLSIPALAHTGCQDSFKDCKNSLTCPPDEEGDGDTSTGGNGDGDGDEATGGNGGEGGAPVTSACDPACSGGEVCKESAGECVDCLDDDDCTDALCDTGSNTCVECLDEADCTDPLLPTCNAGTCEAGCEETADCSEHPGTVCNGDSGECVECTPDTEESQCGAKSCDPARFVCGPHDRESRGACRSCVSDSDCEANHHCVPMEFPMGTSRGGGYCLELAPGCDRPYSVGISGRISLSGESGESYCGINEDVTTCEAVRALEGDWRCDPEAPGDVQCWPPGGTSTDGVVLPGALCRAAVGILGDRCTYECSGAASECLDAPASGSTCGAGVDPDPVAPDYCGGQ